MKKLLFPLACLSLLLPSLNLWSQACKPDYSKIDKIENKKIEAWTCELYETGLGASMFKTSQINITFSIGRMDNSNFVQLQLQKQEESVQNALLESTLKGVKGNEFYFGTKNGDPLKFVATDVTNQTKMNNVLGKMVTTVNLLSEVKNEDLQALKDALTSRIINAIRIKLVNGVVVEQDVKEKKGNKMMEKAVCFFHFQQEKGSVNSAKTTEEVKSKSKDKDHNEARVTTTQKTSPSISKTSDNNIPKSEDSNSSEQFEGVWISETKKRVTLTITKINSSNYEVKQIQKVGPMKKNISPCPSFELINNELVCKQFKIIYLPEKNSIYFNGAEYKKE